MRAAREAPPGATRDVARAGPARLCQALGIDRSLDGLDLLVGATALGWPRPAAQARPRLGPGEQVVAGPRVGVAYAGPEWATRPWRFGIAGHAALSRPFPAAG